MLEAELLEELQLSQRGVSGAEEGLPPRRSKRLRLQREEPEITGPITRFKTRKAANEETTTFAIEVD